MLGETELAMAGDIADPEAEEVAKTPSRDRDLLGRKGRRTPIRRHLDEVFQRVSRGFEEQSKRSDAQMDYWDCYNCDLNSNQFYNGNSAIYVPIVRDAINARATRFVNQLFPQSGQYVEVVAADGSAVNQLVALLNHYIRSRRFKTQVAKPLFRNGDVEGQYNLYVDWAEVERQIVSRETHGPIDPETGQEMPGDEIEDVVEEDVIEGMPVFEVLHDADVLVLPATADSVEEALACGGSVTVVRRWSKAKIDQMIDAGAIRGDEGRHLKETMGKVAMGDRNPEKGLAEHVGITTDGHEAVVWETWTNLTLGDKGFDEDGPMRLVRVFFGPESAPLGCKRNPYWNDRCPLLSAPVEKIAGVFKGESLVAPVASMQYEANDAVNQGADAAAYSALPIIARDPEKGNGPMVLNLAAIWDIEPAAVAFMQFPDLTPRAITRVQYCMQAIFQTLGVNPAMIPQQSGRPGAKRNQAEIAMEQSVDLLTTSEAVSVAEEGVFTPAMGWIVDLDYQFRDRKITVRMFGEMGKQAEMQAVAPLQNRNGFAFVWRGGDQARQNALMMQQGTGWLNVLRGLRQELMAEGMQLRLGPLIEAGTRNIFGPVLGAQTIRDLRDQLTYDPEEENRMMLDGFEVPVHPLDDDQAHIRAHHQALQGTGDPHGTIRVHLQQQLKQAEMKAQAQMMQRMQMQQQGGGQPGVSGPPGISRAGAPPQPGAQPAGPRLVKGPPGMIHPDQMPAAGGLGMPRKM